MTHYKVSLNAENFWLEKEGKHSRMGFYATRYVVAENEQEAENKVSAIVFCPRIIQVTRNRKWSMNPDSIGRPSHIDSCNLTPFLRGFSDIYAFSRPANIAVHNCFTLVRYPLRAVTRPKIASFSGSM